MIQNDTNKVLIITRKNVEDIQGKDLGIDMEYNDLTPQETVAVIMYLTSRLSYVSGIPYNEILEDIKDIQE
jgi:hypothetical protein